ncbi:energy-coupling factor transporter ATP-binding protein EcfA2 [Kitasatospora sp. MAA4]|uniref:hypothetical protein n=1 Tax=Kitasatospora sp. MAA4 TaxID=3035093 RepID=UPI002473ABF3|nr:hypothetical protein [Kitasatospora sp. MAA4]MDH6130944.1 energy-coupling factor transporter ATP-binding protein EcfA2 [Kitasatospora sp. MAA4]
MPENNGAPDSSERIRVGDVSGTMVVGSHNTVNTLRVTAEYGATVTVHAGPLPKPVRRQAISQLPRSGADPLIGRERDLQVLQQAVEKRQLVQIWGASGVGKSALLRHLACTMPRGPEGAAYIEAGGRTADDIAQAIFDIGFDAPNYKPSLEVLKEHLKTLRVRIYLDDAGLDEKDLHRLFDMAEQSSFVFTSQQRSAVAGVHAIQLDGLTAPAGAHLVQTVLARELRPDETRTVQALCDAVHGNPLRLRRIALSAATGKGLPGIADLPELLPALLNRLRPPERDLLHLLGSLSGAELAARQLNALLGRSDTDALADGLVRHGLLLASETGYGCPPDVAGCVLKSRMTEFPADRLCRTLTAWIEARETTPDEVAAHFQALDVAVLRAEKSGHAQLGVTLARAASPKLALSRQFDAWGSLLGAGWTAAKSAGDSAGEEFFLREARTRRKAIGRAAQTAALALEAGVLWHELTVLRAHSAAHQVANAAATTTTPVHTFVPTHGTGHLPPVPHAPATPVPPHAPVAKPVVDFSGAGQHPAVATHLPPSTPAPTPTPARIDLSQPHPSVAQPTPTHAVNTPTPATSSGHTAHISAAQPTHAVSTTATSATSSGHTALTVAGAAGAKGGVSVLALACAFGFVAVLGVGALVYADDQPAPSPAAVSGPVDPSGLVNPSGLVIPPDPSYYTPPAPTFDPVCATVFPQLTPESQQYDTDANASDDASTSYNSAVDAYNSGATSTIPDDSTVVADDHTVVSDLNSIESTLQQAASNAQDSSVETDLNTMLTAAQQIASQYQSFQPTVSGSTIDTASQSATMRSAIDSLTTDCGG